MTVCRLCQCEPMVMTKPETDGITYFMCIMWNVPDVA